MQRKTEYIKDYAKEEVKQYYYNKDFKITDIEEMSKWTPREDNLFDYANVLERYKTIRKPLCEDDYEYISEDEKDKDDYEINL